ncbi:MAG: hypothetical protein DME25_06915, partial [Verrucomicrobia bacterium]
DSASQDPNTLVTARNKQRAFNLQRFSARKPKNTCRIFCLGGSTAYGHPYGDSTSFCGWLRAMLPRADPSRAWELINCGGISYASYREALLMEELIAYEPDLFIILSGHNEFLEQRTYGPIIALPAALRGAGALLSKTRLNAAAKSAWSKLGSTDSAPSSPANILTADVEAILDRTIGPQSYHRDSVLQKQIVDHYRFNLARMVDIARSAHAQVIFITPASNLRDCSPFKSEHRPGMTPKDLERWQGLMQQAGPPRQQSRWAEALALLDQAATVDDRYAELHYARGRLLWQLQRFDEARAAFVRARDEDVCPLRTLTPMLQAVTDVAAARRVPVLDFVKLIDEKSLHGVPGDDWFLDHVHPTIEGHRVLALALMDLMTRQGLARPLPTWTEAAQLEVKRATESKLTPVDHAVALCTLAKVIAWAGKQEEAYRLALRAAELAPEDPAAQFETGKNAARLGRTQEAIQYLQQALALKPTFVEAHSLLGTVLADAGQMEEAARHCRQAIALRPADAQLYLNLSSVLRRQRNAEEAARSLRAALRLSPDYAEAHNSLGWLLKDQGQLTEALAHFRQAVRLRPGSPPPMIGLAWLLATHPDANVRNVSESIRLGQQLVELSAYKNWMSLDTLAAGYAAAGRYPEAVRAAEKALELVQAVSAQDAPAVAERLMLYQQGKPYREPVRPATR